MSLIIQIIDDDQSVRESLVLLMEVHGFQAQSFSSGKDFLRSADYHRGQCIILDIDLDGEDGLDVLRRLRMLNVVTPVIVTTGRPTARARERAASLGAMTFLEKPCAARITLDAVRLAFRPRSI